ncbi:photosystem II protein CyanoQ [Synechococcus sp. BIOS-U3-1]|uniref:photosystem II protein PsbQ n=1 Tax=Synechococcus sp. BIOS-U3-1 TaxID=1400865 RepID=UPI001646D46B|nr:photosystem II protein PsbQ [Synechococcus sp. BIOS-U3-1]QNI60300.1 photosystem II protein CyanoQ [Synechococcus sp. BIOS-U3-1]|tara:strand:- start:74 stop:532 length:459 start_codon:yes stop_codon:yes gene_type:complete
MLSALRRVAALCLCLVLCFGLAACDGSANANPATISPEDMAVIRRQAEGFTAAKDRLPELAKLVDERDWTFTRNLIHGPMQEVGREMLYINQRLLPQDRAEANKLAKSLKDAMADLDEAARLQDSDKLQKFYDDLEADFANYAAVIPEQALS